MEPRACTAGDVGPCPPADPAAIFFDPTRGALATAMDYAGGPSHGNPCIPVVDAFAGARERLRTQVAANDVRIEQLTTLRQSAAEHSSVSLLRERDAVAAVQEHTAALIAAIRQQEAALLASIREEGATQRSQLDAADALAETAHTTLTAATNELRAAEEAAVEAGRRGGCVETAAAAQALANVAHSEKLVFATRFFSFGDTVQYTPGVKVPGGSEAGSHTMAARCAAIAELLHLERRRHPTSVAPVALTGPAAAAAAVASARTYNTAGGLAADVVVPFPGEDPAPGAARTPQGVIHLLGCGARRRRTARELGDGYAPSAFRGQYASPLGDVFDDGPAPEEAVLLQVRANVPVVAGDLRSLSQDGLFLAPAPASMLGVRTASAKGATVWWDFGEGGGVCLASYCLVHGAADESCALRTWRVVASNVEPPAVTARQLGTRDPVVGELSQFPSPIVEAPEPTEGGAEEGETKAASEEGGTEKNEELFEDDDTAVLDVRSDAALGTHAFNAALYTLPAPSTRFYRYLGVQCAGPDAAGPGMYHVELAGAEWYGVLRLAS